MTAFLDNLIASLMSPTGFVISFFSVIFIEDVTLKNIVKDTEKTDLEEGTISRKKIHVREVSKNDGAVTINIRKK